MTYQLNTVQDFLRVPGDRLGACMRDLQYAIELHRLVHGTDAEREPFGPVAWTDDGDHSVTLTDESGEIVLSLAVTSNDKPEAGKP